jgi:hypothetical protein
MRKAILLFPLALVACGGYPSSSAPAMVSLRAAGVNPSTISVVAGAQLQFTNEDTVNHQVASNDCSELSSPILAAGASFTATIGAGPKTCAFSDPLMAGDTAFQGIVTVQQSSTGDAGFGNPYAP